MAKRKRDGGYVVGEKEVMRSARNKERVDRFNELPDHILLHIMDFMDTKDAVRTCILSKRWNNLCKCLTNLTFDNRSYRHGPKTFEKFVSWVLTSRDDSCSLLNLVFDNMIYPVKDMWVDLAVVDRLSEYAVCHSVKQLTLTICPKTCGTYKSLPLIWSCHTLTSLKLSFDFNTFECKMLPKSLDLPALKILHLRGFTFSARDNDCAEPFSNCHVLNILVLAQCYYPNAASVLSICNASLSSLRICGLSSRLGHTCKIVLSTPNLVSCTIRGLVCNHFSSACNLSFLEEVNILELNERVTSSIIIRWLQVLANVKILALTSNVLRLIHADLSDPLLMTHKPPYFIRLESVKVIKHSHIMISDEEVTKVVDHLLQNSPMTKVDINYPSIFDFSFY